MSRWREAGGKVCVNVCGAVTGQQLMSMSEREGEVLCIYIAYHNAHTHRWYKKTPPLTYNPPRITLLLKSLLYSKAHMVNS